MGNDDFCGTEIGVLQIVDDLHGGFLTQLIGVDVNCGKLGGCQFAVKRIIESDDGNIIRNGEIQLVAGPVPACPR